MKVPSSWKKTEKAIKGKQRNKNKRTKLKKDPAKPKK